MKKIFYILFAVCLFTACSDDDNGNDGSIDPIKGDAVTTEQITGTYKAYSVKFDNTGDGFFKDNIELTFNPDNSGEEWNPRTLDKTQFTWSYNDRIISFSYSLHKNVKGWFDKSNLKYKAYFIDENDVQTNTIATYTFIKSNLSRHIVDVDNEKEYPR